MDNASCVRPLSTLLIFILLLSGSREAAPEELPSTLRGGSDSRLYLDGFRDGQTLLVFAHQDDDLVWMLPFWPLTAKFVLAAYPASPLFERLVRSFPPELNYADRWSPAWGTIDDDVYAETFTNRCKRAPIVTIEAVTTRLRPYFTPDVKRVVTHNNWGEYGHVQHRIVNAAVRRLAVEMGLDVWALGARVDAASAGDQAGYTDVAHGLGLPTVEGYFDANLFRAVRQKYFETIPTASTAELTEKFRQWSPTLWTWSEAEDGFPKGWRPFIQLVSRGTDLTVGHAAVERLVAEVPLTNECTSN